MLPVPPTDGKRLVRQSAARCGISKASATIPCKIVQWRATADEDGHYCFAVLDAAAAPEEMNIPGFDFHALRGFKPTRYAVHVNGPWCITFEFEDGDACRVDFEQYH
jgi:plasmid maintenance system killer protein